MDSTRQKISDPAYINNGEKMKKIVFTLITVLIISGQVQAAEGMINIMSDFTVAETANRLEEILTNKGMTVFNRIKHSESAAQVNVELRDTELLIFGNPKVGSPLMKCQQTVAIDLPQKALIWKDENNKIWISYNDPKYLAKRHAITGCKEVISKIEKALGNITKTAATE